MSIHRRADVSEADRRLYLTLLDLATANAHRRANGEPVVDALDLIADHRISAAPHPKRGEEAVSELQERTDLSRKLAAIAHPVRLEMIGILADFGDDGLQSGQIARATGLAAPAASNHLSTLADAGLITSHRDGRLIVYRADLNALAELMAVIQDAFHLPDAKPRLTAAGIGLGITPIAPGRWSRMLRNAPRPAVTPGPSLSLSIRAGEIH